MPAESKAQKGFMGADLARLRSGIPTATGMSEDQLTDFTQGSAKGLPAKKHKSHKKPSFGRSAKPRGG